MFFIFDIDDVFDGMAAGAGLLIKLFIILGLVVPPLGLLKYGEGEGISALAFAFCISALILNIFVLANAIKKMTNKEENKKNGFGMVEFNVDKLKRNSIIVIIAMLILSIIGYIFPLYLSLFNIQFNNITSMIILPFLFNIVFCLMLNGWLHTTAKNKISDYFQEIKEYIVNIFFSKYLLITAIVFFILSVAWMLGTQDDEFKGTIINEKVNQCYKIITSAVYYYDDKYEENRSENFSIEKAVEEQLNYIREVLAKDENEITKLIEQKKLPLETAEPYMTKYANEKKFTIDYLGVKSTDELKTKYGLSIHIYKIPDIDTIWILKVYDSMYEKSYYYRYDVKEYKITETFKDENSAKNIAYEYEQANKN